MGNSLFKSIKQDFPASIIVFFVALPLCLGIALASGAPLLSGVIAGIIGGLVVGAASGSKLGVSGPAAGLAVIVFDAIATLGSWEAFLCAVILAGVLQIIFGFLKAGVIAHFFPSSVITGMLSGIGILIIMKQIPYLFGWHADFLGEESFNQLTGENTVSAIQHAFTEISPSIAAISVASIALLICWEKYLAPLHKVFRMIQGPVAVVFLGIICTLLLNSTGLNLDSQYLVSLPVIESSQELLNEMSFPDLSQIMNTDVLSIALVMAIVASIETLLCVEATDKLDPAKNHTPANRELAAQGLGNIVSGFLGGLPITQVIVRSSANIAFGAQSKMSAILHGVYLLAAIAVGASLLNTIPLASLAAILILVGYKLAKPETFVKMYSAGLEQFLPFIITIAVMVFSDLLTGVIAGLITSLLFTLLHSSRNAFSSTKTDASDEKKHHLVLAEEVTFLNKPGIMKKLNSIPEYSEVVLDFSNTKSLAYDVKESIKDYLKNAKLKNISVKTVKFP